MRSNPARSSHTHPDAPDSTTGETDSAASSSAECAELSAADELCTTTNCRRRRAPAQSSSRGGFPAHARGSRRRRDRRAVRDCGLSQDLAVSSGFERTSAAIEKSATMMHAIRAIGNTMLAALRESQNREDEIGSSEVRQIVNPTGSINARTRTRRPVPPSLFRATIASTVSPSNVTGGQARGG